MERGQQEKQSRLRKFAAEAEAAAAGCRIRSGCRQMLRERQSPKEQQQRSRSLRRCQKETETRAERQQHFQIL